MISSQELRFRVHWLVRSRSGEKLEFGHVFNSKGLTASGLFRQTKLVQAFNVENDTSGIMGLKGKYTSPRVGRYSSAILIGDLLNYNCLNGMGIHFRSTEWMTIGN